MKVFDVLQRTAATLRSRGIAVNTSAGALVPSAHLEELESLYILRLPQELRTVYLTTGDGFRLSWEHEDTAGMFEVQAATDVATYSKRFQTDVAAFADNPSSLTRCVVRAYRSRAFQILESMRLWTPFSSAPNGDAFCIRPDGAVVYHQHDWFDGFGDLSTTNGLVAGSSVLDFTRRWARFMFAPPISLRWRELDKSGSIDWDSSLFDRAFMQPE